MLLIAHMLLGALSPPTATRRALLASSAVSPLLLWRPSSANAASTLSELKAASREERIEKLEEQELLVEMRMLKKAEQMEEAQLRRLRATQNNPLALATNIESQEKLLMQPEEERKEVVADENEIAFINEEYTEGMAKLRAQKSVVAKDRSEVLRRRPTSAMDRLRLKQE